MMHIEKIKVSEWIESVTESATHSLGGFLDGVSSSGEWIIEKLSSVLLSINPFIFIIVLTFLSFYINRKNKKWGFGVFVFLGLNFVYNQDLWPEFMSTLSLILVSSFFAIVLGIPLGILTGKKEIAQTIIKPILDFMQTMPAFVYLIPAVAFFGIGVVPGMVSSIIFSLPPTVRFTSLGLRQIPKEIDEAAISFGATSFQKLFKVELPLARNTIMAGVNQTVMLSLSMVVIASMIGAPGLGRNVVSALQRASVGPGFVAGLSIVVLAIIMDRFTQSFNSNN